MSIGSSGSNLPDGLTLEKPARNLAALATTAALDELRQVVLSQWKHGETFKQLSKYGIRPVDRLLFFGPPGNGKTLAAQWLAQQIGAPLYRVRCETLIVAYLGATAKSVGNVMSWLEKQARCVVLFDEVEMLFPGRAVNKSSLSNETNNAMSVFWQYLDRWESPTLFVLATNMPERLDAALLSRIDHQLEFGPPTVEQATGVIRYWSEMLHEFGGGEWGPTIDDGRHWESFRALFHAVQGAVRSWVSRQGKNSP